MLHSLYYVVAIVISKMLVCVIPTLRTQQPKETKVTYMHTQIQLDIYIYLIFCFLFLFSFYLANIVTDIYTNIHTYIKILTTDPKYHAQSSRLIKYFIVNNIPCFTIFPN